MGKLVYALMLCLIAGVATARVMIPRELQTPSQYLELVREKKKPCAEGCFVEYILLSNGVLVKKHLDTPDYDEATPAFSARRVTAGATEAMLDKAAAFLRESRPESGGHTDPNNIYYFDGEKHYAWSDKKPAPEFSALFDDADAAFKDGRLAEDFYLHAYYQPLTGGTVALHFFSDGTLISSVFDRLSYRMTSTAISRIGDEELSKTKNLVASAQAPAAAKYLKCDAATGLEYGVVEFIHGGTIAKAYACGTGSGDIPALFNHARSLGGN